MHIATATAPGSAHVNPGQPGKTNNQDAIVSWKHATGNVIVVCDGCSTQPLSGIGADIGANIIAKTVIGQLSATTDVEKIEWDKVTDKVMEGIQEIVRVLAPDESITTHERIVLQRFLFTAIVLVTAEDQVIVASFGDGVIIFDDEATILESPILNTPAYMGYLLIRDNVYQTAERRSHLRFTPLQSMKMSELKKGIIIGSDGLKDLLNEDLHHPSLVQPKNLQRWINAQTTDRIVDGGFITGKCNDDVTLAIVRSDQAQKALIESYRDIAELKQSIANLSSRIQSLSSDLDKETRDREAAERKAQQLEVELRMTEKKARKAELFEEEIDKLKKRLSIIRGDTRAKPFLRVVDSFLHLFDPPTPTASVRVVSSRKHGVYRPPGTGIVGVWTPEEDSSNP